MGPRRVQAWVAPFRALSFPSFPLTFQLLEPTSILISGFASREDLGICLVGTGPAGRELTGANFVSSVGLALVSAWFGLC